MKSDLYFIPNGSLHISLMPNTPVGKDAWRQIVAQHGNATILKCHYDSVKRQLNDAGYTVRKAPPVKMSNAELLQALGA